MEKSAYTLHLDEEGYPILDGGLRADDEEFLQLVFQNLKRHEEGDGFPLQTAMEGKQIVVTSFDDPLVAQSVATQGSKVVWNFLGGLQCETEVNEILVDEWQRLHAYVGPGKIPAVMSRKAQADFLHNFPELKNLNPKPYRAADSTPFWDLAYRDGSGRWDMGRINPVFEKHSGRMLSQSGPEWLVPGAGSGYELPFMEKAGKKVTALDLSPTAKEIFHKLYPQSPCNYIAGDFFAENLSTYDAVYENYFFVALDPSWRVKTLERIHQLLKPGGFYGGVFFTRSAPGGPPWGLSEWELRAHTEKLFKIVEWQRSSEASHPRRAHMELWVLLQKI